MPLHDRFPAEVWLVSGNPRNFKLLSTLSLSLLQHPTGKGLVCQQPLIFSVHGFPTICGFLRILIFSWIVPCRNCIRSHTQNNWKVRWCILKSILKVCTLSTSLYNIPSTGIEPGKAWVVPTTKEIKKNTQLQRIFTHPKTQNAKQQRKENSSIAIPTGMCNTSPLWHFQETRRGDRSSFSNQN